MRNLLTIMRAVLLLALALPWLATQAQVQAGPGAWSGRQTWGFDAYHGEALSGYYYWPATPPALEDKRALVLVLHGCLQTAYGDIINVSGSTGDNGFNWKTVADQYGAVILAPNATGNVYFNHCWDYANIAHSRNSGHDAVLLDLVQRFLNAPQFAIDPRQVYVAGLSSGGGETMVLACMAPELFAGAGINAGPPPGTTTFQIGFVPSGYTAARAGSRCKALARSKAPSFATQIASVIWGTRDDTVAQGYGPLDAAAMRYVYGGSYTQGAPALVPGGGSNVAATDANGRLRTTEITVSGMGHAWPAGSGGQDTNFVDARHVNYPAFLMQFWFANNLRISQVRQPDPAGQANGPVMTACGATVSGALVTVTGSAQDAAGAVSGYHVTLHGPTLADDARAGSGAAFSKRYGALASGSYGGTVTATDSATGLASAPCHLQPFVVDSTRPAQGAGRVALVY